MGNRKIVELHPNGLNGGVFLVDEISRPFELAEEAIFNLIHLFGHCNLKVNLRCKEQEDVASIHNANGKGFC